MQTIATFRAGRSAPTPAFLKRLREAFFPPRRPAALRGSCKLLPGQVERITAPGPVEIACPAGRVWITQDGGGPDIVLDAGESHYFSRRGSYLVEALDTSAITLAGSPAGRT